MKLNKIDWKNSSILVTGGTGSFGKKFTEIILNEYNPRRLAIFSRDESDADEIILLDAKRLRCDFPELKKMALEEYRYWDPDCVLIEAKASGTLFCVADSLRFVTSPSIA